MKSWPASKRVSNCNFTVYAFGRISIFHPCVLGLKTTRTTFPFSPRTGPCGTTLATAFGSDLRSVDTLRSSRFALTQPDRFATGVFLRAFLSRRAVARRKMKLFQIVVSNQQRSANSPCRTFREVSCAAKAAFRVRRHGETRRGRWRFHGGRGNASKLAVESPTPIADRRFSMPPDSWSRLAQLHPQNSLKSQFFSSN